MSLTDPEDSPPNVPPPASAAALCTCQGFGKNVQVCAPCLGRGSAPAPAQYPTDLKPWELEPHYCRHIAAMTAEGLHDKADIAAQLAWRDQRILRLEIALADARAPDTEESCDAEIAEIFLAWRVCGPAAGGQLQGAHLLRYRQLPAGERAYFRALLGPLVDPYEFSRTQEVIRDEEGRSRVVYTPPLPEPCTCESPVFIDWGSARARCTRCLHAWRYHRLHPLAPSEHEPWMSRHLFTEHVIDSVNREDMAFAIDLLGRSGAA